MGKLSETVGRLKRRLKEWLEGIEEALAPEPELVPVPVRRPGRPTPPRQR